MLSSRYLELLAGKLVALLFDISFEFIKIDRFSFLDHIFQQRPKVYFLENNRILADVLGNELVTLFQLHLVSEIARKLNPSSIVYFGDRHLKTLLPIYPIYIYGCDRIASRYSATNLIDTIDWTHNFRERDRLDWWWSHRHTFRKELSIVGLGCFRYSVDLS